MRIRRVSGRIAAHLPRPERRDFVPYLVGLGLILTATVLGIALRPYVEVAIVTLTYLMAVLCAAVLFGLLPSLFVALISVLALDFFFLPPLYSLTISAPEDILTTLFFFLVALVTSGLAGRMRSQMLIARGREQINANLYAFSRELAGIVTVEDLLSTATRQIASMLRSRVVILLRESDELVQRAAYPRSEGLTPSDIAAAAWAWQNNLLAGKGTPAFPETEWLLIPLRTARGAVGVLALAHAEPASPLTDDERRLLNTLAGLAGVAIERLILAREIDEARLAREAEKLRAALLASIAHDLRTPVAAILGVLDALRSDIEIVDVATRDELLDTAHEEAARLDRFVANLLDMTRLEAGALELNRDPVELGDLVGSAVARARKVVGGRHIETSIASDLPMLRLDFVLIEHVLFNILDNAAKYSWPDAIISIIAMASASSVQLQVMDEGPGIRDEDLDRIFDKFYRASPLPGRRAGAGLGLAICRGFVEAHGGSITASNRPNRRGAVFTITFPHSAMAPRRNDVELPQSP